MMAFVKNVAGAAVGSDIVGFFGADSVLHGLRHHQGVIGYDYIGRLRPAKTPFDEAGSIVGTSSIDAFAAPVGQLAKWNESGKESRKACAGKIAIRGRCDPSCDQAERDGALAGRHSVAFGGVLEIQQTKIVLATLAQHSYQAARARIALEFVHLLQDLALQIARVSRYPEARAVLFRPQRGRCQIAERLARAGARFDQSNSWRTRSHPGREGGCGSCGKFLLLRTGGALASDQGSEACLRFLGFDGLASRASGRRLILPFRKPAPAVEPGEGTRQALGFAQNRKHKWSPAPTGLVHE